MIVPCPNGPTRDFLTNVAASCVLFDAPAVQFQDRRFAPNFLLEPCLAVAQALSRTPLRSVLTFWKASSHPNSARGPWDHPSCECMNTILFTATRSLYSSSAVPCGMQACPRRTFERVPRPGPWAFSPAVLAAVQLWGRLEGSCLRRLFIAASR